jgi:uncharacterized MAPEG superfamily protein
MTAFLWIAALVIAANAIYFLYRSSKEARQTRRIRRLDRPVAEAHEQRLEGLARRAEGAQLPGE